MTTETILTDEEVQGILSRVYNYPLSQIHPTDLRAWRAIEQAVLQSPEVQALRKDASLAAEHRKLLEGAAAVLENCADDMEDEGDEIGAHEARSMANVINAAMEQQHDP